MDDSGKMYDLSFLKRVSGDDDSFILDMIETFRATAPDIISKMECYLEQERYEALSREAHRFIPGVSFLGVKVLEHELIDIEEFSKNNENLQELPPLIQSVKIRVDKLIQAFIQDFNLKPC